MGIFFSLNVRQLHDYILFIGKNPCLKQNSNSHVCACMLGNTLDVKSVLILQQRKIQACSNHWFVVFVLWPLWILQINTLYFIPVACSKAFVQMVRNACQNKQLLEVGTLILTWLQFAVGTRISSLHSLNVRSSVHSLLGMQRSKSFGGAHCGSICKQVTQLM